VFAGALVLRQRDLKVFFGDQPCLDQALADFFRTITSSAQSASGACITCELTP